jgi:glutamyl-tRNA reductase
VPRDIAADVEQLDNVYLYNIDHLQTIVRENSRQREQELAKCNGIIARRAGALMAKIQPVQEKWSDQEVELLPGWILSGAVACRS